MKATFACATCGGAVGYDLVAVETHEYRQYGVNHYECTEPCATCEGKDESTVVPLASAAHEPIDVLVSVMDASPRMRLFASMWRG